MTKESRANRNGRTEWAAAAGRRAGQTLALIGVATLWIGFVAAPSLPAADKDSALIGKWVLDRHATLARLQQEAGKSASQHEDAAEKTDAEDKDAKKDDDKSANVKSNDAKEEDAQEKDAGNDDAQDAEEEDSVNPATETGGEDGKTGETVSAEQDETDERESPTVNASDIDGQALHEQAADKGATADEEVELPPFDLTLEINDDGSASTVVVIEGITQRENFVWKKLETTPDGAVVLQFLPTRGLPRRHKFHTHDGRLSLRAQRAEHWLELRRAAADGAQPEP